jgi:hypothetical protein
MLVSHRGGVSKAIIFLRLINSKALHPWQLYYEKLPMYIQAILEMTLSAIQKESDAVARQATTFWTTVCDVEYDMLNSDEGEVRYYFLCVEISVLMRRFTSAEQMQEVYQGGA